MTERPEHPEHPARALHDQTEHLTFTQAAERLHITPNAVRMRVHRGTLTSIRVHERTCVVWPQPAQVNAQRTNTARAHERTDGAEDARVIARLESENAHLRQMLDREIEARRRADHIILELGRRFPELGAGAPARDPPPPQGAEHHGAQTEPLRRRMGQWLRAISGR
jgi:hypothetical protein